MTKLIETVDLVTNFYTYEGVVKALDSVSLNIDHGITFGLVGESGCGKSVFVRSMMRIIQEPAEAIDLLQQTESYMRALRGDSISMIFQEPNAALNPIMSIGDQVSESFLFHRKAEMCKTINADLNADGCRTFYPLKKVLQALYRTGEKKPDAWILKVISRIPVLKRWDQRLRKEALRRSIEIIEKLGIANAAEIAQRYPHNLSGGMKQRIVIAIALACNPILLIADEATSNLDVTIQAQILELLKELKQKEISSVLLITHDLGRESMRGCRHQRFISFTPTSIFTGITEFRTAAFPGRRASKHRGQCAQSGVTAFRLPFSSALPACHGQVQGGVSRDARSGQKSSGSLLLGRLAEMSFFRQD
jgi:peptide/nickel transport system ATP-binding protein